MKIQSGDSSRMTQYVTTNTGLDFHYHVRMCMQATVVHRYSFHATEIIITMAHNLFKNSHHLVLTHPIAA